MAREWVLAARKGAGFRGGRGCCWVAAGFGNHVAEGVHVAEHFIEPLGRTLELRTITLALEEIHRVLDDVEEVEQLRDGPTQLSCVSSSWRRREHSEKMGASGICFKRA